MANFTLNTIKVNRGVGSLLFELVKIKFIGLKQKTVCSKSLNLQETTTKARRRWIVDVATRLQQKSEKNIII